MPNLLVELKCPEHGFERFKIKVIKKYNINPELIMPKYRTRPRHEIKGIIVGRSISYTEIRDYMVQHYKETGLIDRVLSIKLQL